MEKPEDFTKRIEQLENSGRNWNRYFPRPNDFFAVDVSEALFFSNNDKIVRDLLSTGGGKLARRIMETEEVTEAVETAFQSALTRKPDPKEKEAFSRYLADRQERKADAASQIVWALLTSAEFRFNN